MATCRVPPSLTCAVSSPATGGWFTGETVMVTVPVLEAEPSLTV